MILVIDNFDSFTYNIVQYLQKLGYETHTRRNNEIELEEIEKMAPDHILISPGPGRPDDAGISLQVIDRFKGKIPILGICLGHQSIGQAFGAKIVHAKKIYHGKTSRISHNGKGLFDGIPSPYTAVRYHSLVIDPESLPDCLEITAMSDNDEIMGVCHREYDIAGVQYHPESIASEAGYELLLNFLKKQKMDSVMKPAIKKVWQQQDLNRIEAKAVMNEITDGKASPAQIAALLTSLSLKGETVEEITGFAEVMREKATKIAKPHGKKVLDTCGTGGDSSGTFNISTVSAFVAAGAGICVAKHGNRSITSRCGSADLLESLGVNLDITPEKVSQALAEVGIGFLFAQKLHMSMKHAVGVRKDIGIRTVFNILGPLSNPASADYQLMGVFDASLTEKLAAVMSNLGIRRGMVVHGSDGLDEITLCGTSRVSEIKGDWIKTYDFDPADYGFEYCSAEALKGGTAEENKEIAQRILSGEEQGPKRDIVLINAANAIISGSLTDDFKAALDLVKNSIDSGKAMAKLKSLVEFTNS